LPLFYDAVQTVEEIIGKCLKNNIEILSITEHDSLAPYNKAKKIIAEKKLPIILVPGCEISTKDGHILAYGILEEISPGLSAEETVERIHQQGGIALAAHPFMYFFSLKEKIFDLQLDGLEGINSTIPSWLNLKALAAAKKMGWPAVAGSDAHSTTGTGTGRTIFGSNLKKWQDVIEDIKRGRFKTEVEYQSWPGVLWDSIRENVMSLWQERSR